ncbi:shikimate kinase [Mobilicoccus pelagius]|uniref:Shikimate kinase n=1 Tax=Mobilicoccus pelagius NBRC 104925 TaxID=1089455 RepID=H5UV40_9MICO|nr:shikimate kinase [Mobilicoccus pelagius]GAB49598.1 shikimate kinase [Mobilicoccus pelagius NBRC 104925]
MTDAASTTSTSSTARPLAVLTGPPGAGKSSVGAALARRRGVDLLDTDALVEQRAGISVPEIFVEQGEEAFRALERTAVADALAGHDGVVSLGGGAILDPHTQELLAGHRVVFLDVSLRYAAKRSGFDQGRPLLALNPRGQWLQLMEQRRPIYERLAWLRVDTDEKDVEQIVDEIADRLAADGSGRGERTGE